MQIKRLVYFLAFLFSVAIARSDTTQLTTLSLSAGQKYGLALRSDGSVWAWGTNQVGETGLGTNKLTMSPTRITGLTNILSVSAGSLHSLAVQSNGAVWAWGANSDGRLGNGTFVTSSNPVPVTRITNAIMVAAGASHSLAVLADGRVMAWGANAGGQLGIGNATSTNQPVTAGSFTNVIAVTAGTNFSLALTRNGDVWSWGTNNLGQLGLGNTTSQLSPVKITTLSNIVQITAGSSHSLAMDANGVVYAWGRNAEGQIGDGTTVNVTTPKVVAGLGTVKSVEAGYNSSAAVLKTGRLFYWGWYGNGSINSSNQPPQELNANSGLSFQNVSYGDSYLLAGQTDGSTWAWGFNQYAQWGNGNLYDINDNKGYDVANSEFSFSPSPHPLVIRFNRGDRNDNAYATYLPYDSFVLPMDLEKGVKLDNQGSDLYCYGAGAPWFLKVQKTTRQHAWQLVGGTTNLTRFAVDNPIVAFGSDAGGSPLYVSQPYTFGFYAGAYDETSGQTNRIRILVYDRAALASGATNIAPTNIITVALPRRYIAADSNAWSNFVTNWNRVVVETNGLRTVVQFADGQNSVANWGLGWNFAIMPNVDLCGYILTQTATSTNYCYVVEGIGSVEVGANVLSPMGLTNNTMAYLPLYTASFDAFPSLLSHFIDNPNFVGTPLPPTYAGRSSAELNGMIAVITNNIWITNNSAYTNLDNSPELRRHPILDQFVNDMGRDPLALANYVINEIDLTDPMANMEQSRKVADSIEVGGVNRSALGTFLEGQGSPTEQCALLVYLLRAAGYPAAYVWPTNSNMKLLDTTVSRLWQVNVHGVIFFYGLPIVTNSLITVNYPWVVANIGTNTVQIFPWLKNTEIVEGQDIYDYMPTNYFNAYSWVKAYALADPSLMALGSPNDGTASIWKKYLTNLINTNTRQSNLSLDDFGVRAFNRRNTYTSWSQLPLPNFLTNQSKVAVVQTLSDSPTTYPFLTNIFDTIRVEVFKGDTNTVNRLFDTGLWRSCDFHNRKLLLYTNAINNVSLWMSAYRPSVTAVTNFQNFNAGLNSLDLQIAQTNIVSTVSNFPVRISYTRRDAILTSPAPLWYITSEYLSPPGLPTILTCWKSDVSAIIPGVAKVTPAMLQVYAEDYWSLEQQRAVNTNFVPAITSEAGDSAMILASTFFQKLWSDDQFNQHLHKVHSMSWFSQGVAAMTHLTNNQMQLKLNMNWFSDFVIGNGTLHEDSGDSSFNSLNNYLTMLQANASSAEHSVISSVWGDPNPVSSVRLLQLASQRAVSNGWAAPMELNVKNYTALGNQAYTGYGATLLKNQIPSLWTQITNTFATAWDANYTRALITPGLVTNITGAFKGMSALIMGKWAGGAVMSDNQFTLNGGWSAEISWMGSYDTLPTYSLTYSLSYAPSFGYTFVYNSYTAPQPRYDFSQYDVLTLTAASSSSSGPPQIAFTPQQSLQASTIAGSLNLPLNSTASYIKTGSDVGWLGRAWAGAKQGGTVVADPVQVVSGDFCADSVDVALAGPMPLQLRRNYLSRNLANNQFGAGWKLSFTPWLVLTTNAANNTLAYAAEVDGSVIAYRYQSNNVWTVTSADNPSLVNFTSGGVGATANLFNNSIQQNATNSSIYLLLGSDGSKRTYQVMTNFAITTGTNQLNRIRPYLTRWEDHAGNYYQFLYGSNPTNDDFGQLNRVQGANGAALTLKYDFYGRIIQAITDDGRIVRYEYDSYGDLLAVTLPDNSAWQYGYDHYTFTTNSQTYTDSDHLLITETKPNGRQLINTYDSLRRVIAQQATVGINRELITNAWFFYTNDCTTLTNDSISGLTRVDDVFHNSYFYYYTNNLVTQIQEPLGRTKMQNWFDVSEANKAGYYPNSLEFTVDVRGLTNTFWYDSNGNITNQVAYGDLTGNGIGGDSATNTYAYTTNNCPATAIDASGNQMVFLYENLSDTYQLTSLQFLSSGVGIATNHWNYSNVTSVVTLGNLLQTNNSFGVCTRQILADSATNEWIYNGRGFPVQNTRYAVTADLPSDTDPAVITYLSFTPRGDLVAATDANGRQTSMNYDEMGRIQWRDAFDESSNSISRETFYYNRNGDLEWYDGPRSNPDDLIWFSYDGAGRKVQEIRWRSRAKADGTGIEAETGNNLYATTFYSYDPFGNLKTLTDQRGAMTTNAWDALGRLAQRKSFDTDGVTLLASETFAYEVGGLVHFYTNALGGVTEIRYTSTGQPRFRQNANGSTNSWTYYSDGRIRRELQGNGAYWETSYNDANRTIKRIFYSKIGLPLATNAMFFDRRGNVVQWTDAANNAFTNVFDGLGRLKTSMGPAIATVSSIITIPGGATTYSTNVLQQTVTYIYDASGKTLTVSNAVGEKAVTTRDVLGRTLSIQTYAPSNGTPLRVATIAYSTDNNSYTATTGSGANAISTTTYLDTEGRSLLTVASPAANTSNLIRRQYDPVGNILSESQASIINGSLTTWQTSTFSFDGLNRVRTLTERDNATTTFSYDPAGDLLQRAMPGNLTWSATYNVAGQILTENDSNGASTTRSNAYTYYAPGNQFAGLLNTLTDGIGVTRTGAYDDWLRTTNVTTTGLLPEQQMAMGWQYDARGFVTGITQSFANTNAGSSTEVRRSYDIYGQLGGESINLGGAGIGGASQSWDTAGRRTSLTSGTWGVNFQYRADGLMTAANGSTFGYADNGLMVGRTNSFRSYTVNQRDGVGHPLQATTSVLLGTALSESWNWLGDGSPSSYVAGRSDFTDTRNYAYGSLNRRLIQESYNVASSQLVTNSYTFDNGASGGLGMLTKAVESSSTSNSWSGGQDAFSRVINGTNSIAHRPAYGDINGKATITALLDGRPVAVTVVGTNGGQWRTTLDLTPGTHQLTASALHPSGLFVTNATVTFTNTAADYAKDAYDGNGQITNRVWVNSSGQTNRTQALTWDAFGRLMKVSERDNQNSGFNWQADFDPLGRRIRTTIVNVTNNFVVTSQPTVITHYYDPQVEFMEIGMNVNGGLTTWKMYGPDLDGIYGGQQGLGGLESLATGFNTAGLIQDSFGDILGSVTNATVSWNAARVNTYGPVAGYPSLSLETSPLTAEHLAWRGKWRDVTSLYYWGARPYDSERRAFMSSDPLGHAADASLYSAFNGTPTVYWDADGRDAFRAFFPASAAAMGARPFSGSTGGDISWVHGVVYPTMQLPFTPLMEPHIQGGMKVIGGATETTVGSFGLATTSETGVGAYLSSMAILHGADVTQSGFRQMLSGNPTPSVTASHLTRWTGSPFAGEMLDSGISVGLTMGASLTVKIPSAIGPVSHLTSPDAYQAIMASRKIGARAGIFGVQTTQVPSSSLGRFLVTMVPRNLSREVIISGDAASIFNAPKPVGPFSMFRNFAGVRSAPLGSIDLAAGQFIPGEVMMNGTFRQADLLDQAYYFGHQAILDYGVDAGLYSLRAAQGYSSGVDAPESIQTLSKH